MPKDNFYIRNFTHPYTCELLQEVHSNGVDGLLNPPSDSISGIKLTRQSESNEVTKFGDINDGNYEFEFDIEGAYSNYNWELFYHMPLLVATRYMQNQQFEKAQKWFHYIFDPTTTDKGTSAARFWKLKPFFKFYKQSYEAKIEEILKIGDPAAKSVWIDNHSKAIKNWIDNPFNPHAVARVRIVAYMKTVVIKYIENLINWGDHLFKRDTIESLNEATQYYILASQILGRKPVEIQKEEFDSNTFESATSTNINVGEIQTGADFSSDKHNEGLSIFISILYFCIPENEKILTYWDTIADRLFKIRNCMNIEGVVRQLPLFEPPIDPALLVRAQALGLDLNDVLDEVYSDTRLPNYRFAFLLQKAKEFCGEVKSLGSALLSAIEKRDAEKIALLRASHDRNVNKAINAMKKQNIKEAKANLESVQRSEELIHTRFDHYSSREYINAGEAADLMLRMYSTQFRLASQSSNLAASASAATPDYLVGAAGWSSPVSLAKYGGSNVSNSTAKMGSALNALSEFLNLGAMMASITGSYNRRQEEWNFQADLAEIEKKQIKKQILASQIRLDIAEKDAKIHERQIDHSNEIYDTMKRKFSNEELYDWMAAEVSKIYFQSYSMAYDLAKKAERAMKTELNIDSSERFVESGYWDGRKEGLLAGEKLAFDLNRMEKTYIDRNKRRIEVTQSISMLMTNPQKLLDLRTDGNCDGFNISEVLFDLYYPGHYNRRIKSVRITIPCITGPYANVACKLTLKESKVRKTADLSSELKSENANKLTSISTSSGVNDAGVFELNFRDERFLPFESSGAVSTWKLELPSTFKAFDYNSISDVIFHVSYTADDGGDGFRGDVMNSIENKLSTVTEEGLIRMFSLKSEFPEVFHQLKKDGESNWKLTKEHFPAFVREKELVLKLVDTKEMVGDQEQPIDLSISAPPEAAPSVSIGVDNKIEGTLNDNSQDVLVLIKYSGK